MEYKDIGLLSVIYHENETHVNLAKSTLTSTPKEIKKLAVVNKSYDKQVLKLFDSYIKNDMNCLSKAWNIGLKKLFEDYNYVLVMGLDHLFGQGRVKDFLKFVEDNPGAGLWAMTPNHMVESFTNINYKKEDLNQSEYIAHGDGSFSCFIIEKEAYEKIGDFDENFIPAYFEDNDYLERAWLAGYKPLRATNISYYHIFQATVKTGDNISLEYPAFMQKNLEYFVSKWNKVPSHLPTNIRFN